MVTKQSNGKRLGKGCLMVRYVFVMLCAALLLLSQGTVPFVSRRALEHWLTNPATDRKPYCHLPEAGHATSLLSASEISAHKNLNTNTYELLTNAKGTFCVALRDYDSSFYPDIDDITFLMSFMDILQP
jgi:hypothetical protein